MLKRGANPIAYDYRALRGAVMNKKLEVVQELFNAISNPLAKRKALKIIESGGQYGMPDLSKVLPRGKGIQE